jgi:hypothetical protein
MQPSNINKLFGADEKPRRRCAAWLMCGLLGEPSCRATLISHRRRRCRNPPNFACIEGATAKGSPVRKVVDMASRQGRVTGGPGAANTVVITCSEAQAEELLRLAQVSCRAAMQDIKIALAEAREGKRKP